MLPPFFFHYVICVICVIYLVCIAILKFKYYYWYNQPLVFRFSVRRLSAARQQNTFTSINYSVKDGDCFPHCVDCQNVKVYPTNVSSAYLSIPFEKIAKLLNKDNIIRHNSGSHHLVPYVHSERLSSMITNDTHGLSAFVGVYVSSMSGSNNNNDDIHGVCILTPRIKIERQRGAARDQVSLSTSIYMCEHLAWSRYDVNDRQSLELLETTQSFQRHREISGEQTLYRYNEIPWFVIPFTSVYTYALSLERLIETATYQATKGGGIGHTTLIKVSSVNFALFYAFINERSRDFSCSILNEITHLQHLIQSEIYHIYMLLLNNTRILSAYIFGPSWGKVCPRFASNVAKPMAPPSSSVLHKKTRGNRIEKLHNYISQTSTAVIKYLPPVIPPKYDLSGKRVVYTKREDLYEGGAQDSGNVLYQPSNETICLLSSVCDKRICGIDVFRYGFVESLKKQVRDRSVFDVVLIDTIAHNYMIIDELVRSISSDNNNDNNDNNDNADTSTLLLWYYKWHYVLYNSIIHREILCKDLFLV